MLDEEDFGGAGEVLGDEEATEGVAGGTAGVADYVGSAEGDALSGEGRSEGVEGGLGRVLMLVVVGREGEGG